MIAIDSQFVKIEPIQIVLGDADDAEYTDARRLFIFFKTNILSAFICARLRHLRSLIQTGYIAHIFLFYYITLCKQIIL